MRPPLTKENLLERVDQAEVMERYLGFPVEQGKSYVNPLRSDSRPGCSFYMRGDRLFFHDFADRNYGGDIFTIVALYHQLKGEFYTVLRIINQEFKLGLDSGYSEDSYHEPVAPRVHKRRIETQPPATISYIPTDYSEEELEWWKSGGATENLLRKENIDRCQKVWIRGEVYYIYNKNPCYAWPCGERTKIYQPFSDHRKWRSNVNNSKECIQGWSTMTSKPLIITKSMKDRLPLLNLGYNTIAPQTEGYIFSEETIDIINQKVEIVYILYDNDETGIKESRELEKKTGWRGLYPYKDVKDTFEFVQKYSLRELKEVLNEYTK